MKFIQKYLKGKRVKRNTSMPDFNRMKSIYNEDGTLKSYSDLGFNSLEDLYKTLETTIGKGYGSFKFNGEDYTIYLKDSNGKIIKPWELELYKGLLLSLTNNPEYYKDVEENSYNNLGLMAAANYINKPKNGGYQTYRPIFNQESTTESNQKISLEPEVIELNTKKTTTLEEVPFYKKYYGLNESQFRNLSSVPDTGRNSLIRKHVLLLENQRARLEELKGTSIVPKFINDDPLNTFKFILNNADLTKARRGKDENYLYMESDRLNRDIGGYKGLTYRHLLNYFSPENSDKYSGIYGNGRYKDRYNDFYKRLYNLSASRNGMQRGELDDLFGKDYDKVLKTIANELKIEGYLQGGILEMLFI